MPPPPTLPPAILETVLIRLAVLFITGAGGDMEAARQAASQMIQAYRPETLDQLHLAANIVAFSFQALEALAQAAAPDLPLTRIMRLRGSAVSLSRESGKAERRLAQLQKPRQQPDQNASIQREAARPQPKIENAIALIQDTNTVAASAKANGLTWTQAHDLRQRDLRIAASIKRAEARIASQPAPSTPNAVPDHQPMVNGL